MAKLFGFDITRKKKDLISFAAPENTDGAVDVSVGGALGHYIDMEGKIKNEIELINKYRSLATESEVDAAIDDVVNESVVISSEREDAIFLDLNDLGASAAIKDKIHDEFTYLLRFIFDFTTKINITLHIYKYTTTSNHKFHINYILK